MEWFRWYGGTLTDPKFQWVANKSCQGVAAVVAVWVAVLERAHDNECRGCCEGLDFESLDVALHLDDGSAHDIYQAFIRKAMIVENGMVANWEKRQPKREDETAAERKKDYRDRIKLQKENEDLQKQIDLLKSQMSHNVPQCPTMSHEVPTEESRREEKREEEPLKPKTSSSSPDEETATPPDPPPDEKPPERLAIFEFRLAYQQATGELLPGGLNQKALQLCHRHPRDKLQQAFEQMALHGGKTFAYLNEVLKGNPKSKAVVEGKSKSEQRQAGAVANAQATIRRLQEIRNGTTGTGTADTGADGTDGYAGHPAIDRGTTAAVSPGAG